MFSKIWEPVGESMKSLKYVIMKYKNYINQSLILHCVVRGPQRKFHTIFIALFFISPFSGTGKLHAGKTLSPVPRWPLISELFQEKGPTSLVVLNFVPKASKVLSSLSQHNEYLFMHSCLFIFFAPQHFLGSLVTSRAHYRPASECPSLLPPFSGRIGQLGWVQGRNPAKIVTFKIITVSSIGRRLGKPLPRVLKMAHGFGPDFRVMHSKGLYVERGWVLQEFKTSEW